MRHDRPERVEVFFDEIVLVLGRFLRPVGKAVGRLHFLQVAEEDLVFLVDATRFLASAFAVQRLEAEGRLHLWRGVHDAANAAEE